MRALAASLAAGGEEVEGGEAGAGAPRRVLRACRLCMRRSDAPPRRSDDDDDEDAEAAELECVRNALSLRCAHL